MWERNKLKALAEEEVWFHSIDLGNGLYTKGQKSKEALKKELATIDLPDLKNKTVLDIGTSPILKQ